MIIIFISFNDNSLLNDVNRLVFIFKDYLKLSLSIVISLTFFSWYRKGTYVLEDLTGSLLQRDVPVNQIKLIEAGDRRSRNELKEKHYDVEAIFNHRKTSDGKTEYLTDFVGYSEPEWINESNFDSKATIGDYWSRRKAIKYQQNGQFNLPDTINRRRNYNRRHFNIKSSSNNNKSKGNSNNLSANSITSPSKHVMRRSNRLNR